MSIQKRGAKIKMKGIYNEITLMPLSEIIPYDKNPKKHPQEQIEKLSESIKAFGFDQPIVVDEHNIIIKGHGRRLASQLLGLKRVPVVVRTDLSSAQVRASRIADNQTAESYWDMSNLIYELETLYSMGGDESLGATGYEVDELKTILPGLLENEVDYVIQDIEGVVPIDLAMTSPDGLVGNKIKSGGTLVEWVQSHDNIIILFNGNRTDLAALCWAIDAGIDPKIIKVIDFSFGQRMWRWHDDYLNYIEEKLGVTIIRGDRDSMDKFKEDIKEKGYPTEDKPWCCNIYKRKALKDLVSDETSVVIFGITKNEEGNQIFRERGVLVDFDLHYAAPFATGIDKDITDIIQKSEVELNPAYKRVNQYLCPGCPYYHSPDYVMLKEHDLDLWIRWVTTLGRAQYNAKQLQDGILNAQLLRMIGDGVDARDNGKYMDMAMDLPDCPQPVRDTIRVGDDYGWDEKEDAKLPDSGYLDKPRDRWFEHEDYSKSFYTLGSDCAKVQASIEEKGYDKHMEDSIAEARLLAEEVPEEDDEDTDIEEVKED